MRKELKQMQIETYHQLSLNSQHKVREKYGDVDTSSSESDIVTDIDVNVVQKTADNL